MNTKAVIVVLSALFCFSAAKIIEWDCSEAGKHVIPNKGFYCVFWGMSTCSASENGHQEFEIVDGRNAKNPVTKAMNMIHMICNTEENKPYCRANNKVKFPRLSAQCNGVWTEYSGDREANAFQGFCNSEFNKCKK